MVHRLQLQLLCPGDILKVAPTSIFIILGGRDVNASKRPTLQTFSPSREITAGLHVTVDFDRYLDTTWGSLHPYH